MGNKEHRWRLRSSTFWNSHPISNSKRLGIFLGANQILTLYLEQNLLPLNSDVNRNLGCVQSANISCKIARVRKSILNLGFDRFLFESVGNEFHGNNKIPCYEGNPKHQKIKFCPLHDFCSFSNARASEEKVFMVWKRLQMISPFFTPSL